jgi:hypothetical protein
MHDAEIVKTSANGRYRVSLEMDMDAAAPYDETGSPILRMDYRGGRWNAIHVGTGVYAGESNIEGAADRWGSPSGDTFGLFVRYLKVFHGVTEVETWYSGDYWYVTYDSAAWREAIECPAAKPDMSEYKAWVEGEVYGVIVERLDTWERADDNSFTMDSWTEVESAWGHHGYEYATEAASEMLSEYEESEVPELWGYSVRCATQ